MQAVANARGETSVNDRGQCDATASAVTWPAIIAGAFTAVAVSLVLLLLGSGLGMASVSPWGHAGVSAVTFTVGAAIWLIVMQWVASGLGGYLTGRLRCKWVNMHTDEVFFRDTAHGFLAWALATVITAAFLASAVSSIAGGAASAATTVAAGAAAGASQGAAQDPATSYFVDSLFRSDGTNPAISESDVRAETSRILIRSVKNDGIPEADKVYLAQLVALRTGLPQADASKRVEDVLAQINAAETKLREAGDKARKTVSTFSLFTFLSMLIGAFIASAAGALGGRHRDESKAA